jgi:serine/threonine protein kinase
VNYEVFGKYVLLEKLAMGGMAEVWLARSIGSSGVGKFVAVKRILPQFSEQTEFIEMFREEANIAINLQHANIVTINEFGEEKVQFYIVMDLVNGRNLKQILNKVKTSNVALSIEHIVYICKEIAAGLDYAHRCIDPKTAKPLNIIHRDMSPHNVMISFEGEVKVVDFGIAKAETQVEATRAGTLKGKFGYMSPEQADAQQVDQRTDIFSLGIIMWELLANDRLFVGKNEIEILRKIKDCSIQPLRKLNATVPPELEKIVAKSLAKDRNLRYRNADDFHRDLHKFLNVKYPDFSKADFAKFLKNLFSKEIEDVSRKLLDYAKTDFSHYVSVSTGAQPAATEKTFVDTLISSTQPTSAKDVPTATEALDVQSNGKLNIIDSKNDKVDAKNLRMDGAGANVANSYSSSRSAAGTNLGGTRSVNTYGTNAAYGGTYNGTRSKASNSYGQPSSGYGGLIVILLVLGVLIGGGVFYVNDPKQFNSIISQLLGTTKPTVVVVDPKPKDPDFVDMASTAAQRISKVAITSEPSGAEVLINDKSVGEITPTTINLPEGQTVKLTLRAPGYLEYNQDVIVQQNQMSVRAAMSRVRVGYLEVVIMGAGQLTINGEAVQAQNGRFTVPADAKLVVLVLDPVTKAGDEVHLQVAENANRRVTLIPRQSYKPRVLP